MAYVEYPINSHLERLEYDEIRERPSLFGDVWLPSFMGLTGFAAVLTHNHTQNKPLYTGAWRLGVVPLLVYAGVFLRDYKREMMRVKWAKIRQYIELHPEDFPPYPRRVKVGETLTPWIPARTGW